MELPHALILHYIQIVCMDVGGAVVDVLLKIEFEVRTNGWRKVNLRACVCVCLCVCVYVWLGVLSMAHAGLW